jgi:hypothetical protein
MQMSPLKFLLIKNALIYANQKIPISGKTAYHVPGFSTTPQDLVVGC